MAYERIAAPESELYHYTRKENLLEILKDSRIRKFKDKECWFCASLEDTLQLMELTVMQEGGLYIDTNGFPKRYQKFVPDDYVILKLAPRYQNGDWVRWQQEVPPNSSQELLEQAKKFSELKIGYRGDMKFRESPKIIEISEALQLRAEEAPTLQGFYY